MKQVFSQIAGLWRELGLNQRITLGVSALVVVGVMIGLLVWAQRPQMKLLYGRLGEKEAGEVVQMIQEQGIPYELGGGGTSIYVPSEHVYKLRMDLAAKGLPGGDGVGFEIFDRSNFGISDFVQRTNYTRALQGELGRTISQLKGVRSAKVLVVLPESRLLLKTADSRATASVFIDTGGLTLEQAQVGSIRSLVANAVEGLRLNDVAVIDAHGNVLSEQLKDDPLLGSANSQMKFKKQTEDYLSDKVETMLAKVLGPGNAVVRVSADINNESATVTEEKFDPESQVARSESTTEETSLTSEKTEKGGATNPVGVDANVPVDPATASASSPTKTSNDDRKTKTQTYEISRSTTNLVKNPGQITRITAAVFLAPKAAAAGAQPTPRTPEELASLRRMVVNALGIQGKSPKEIDEIVSLEEASFPAQAEASGMNAEKLTGYAEAIRPLAAVGIAVVVLFLFMRWLNRTKPDEISFELVEEHELLEGATTPAAAAPGLPNVPVIRNNKVSPELLNDLIRQKPENVGATLREWLSDKK